MKTEYVCYHCGKAIKGPHVHTSPPLSLIRLGLDFPKTYHPACYAKAEEESFKLLHASA